MPHWSAENATRAYLRTLNMGKRGKEPDVAEFISAIAGGNNAQFMVEVCGSTAGPTTVALLAAAQQTGGRVVCILPGPKELGISKSQLSPHSDRVEFVTGDPLHLLNNTYKGADFVIVDCKINGHKGIIETAQQCWAHKGGIGPIVVGYNAQIVGPKWNGLGAYFLPIGDGLLVCTKPKNYGPMGCGSGPDGKRSKWIVKVDKCTGEEHVFRITCSHQKVIQA